MALVTSVVPVALVDNIGTTWRRWVWAVWWLALFLGFVPGAFAQAKPMATATWKNAQDAWERHDFFAVQRFAQTQAGGAGSPLGAKGALDEAGHLALVHQANGLALAGQGQLDMAEEQLRLAVQQVPQSAVGWHNLGWLSCQRGRWAEAQSYLRRAADLATVDAGLSWLALGICSAKAGQQEVAIEQMLAGLALDPEHLTLQYNLARLYLKSGNWVAAKFYLEPLAQPATWSSELLGWLVLAEQRLGQPAAAQQWALLMRQHFPNSAQVARLN